MRSTLLIGTIFFGTHAFGSEEESKISIQINQPILLSSHYVLEQGDVRRKTDVDAMTPTTTELVISVGSYHLHLFPTSVGAPVQLGWDAWDKMEAGFTLAQNRTHSDNPASTFALTQAGVYGVQGFAWNRLNFEVGLSLDYTQKTSKDQESNGTTSKVIETGTQLAANLSFVQALAHGFSYVATIAYASARTKYNEMYETSRFHGYTIIPATVRLDF